MSKKSEFNKFQSRKYKLTLYTIAVSTIMAVLPPLLSSLFIETPIIILTGAEWVAVTSGALLFYNGSNVLQKTFSKGEQNVDENTEQ